MIGSTPFGTGAYGLETSTPSAQTTKTFCDLNGNQQGSRYVDASTGDYVFVDGLPIGENNLHHRIRLAILTVRGSSVDFGLGIAEIGSVITESIRLQRAQDVRQALSRLVKEKLIEVVSVAVDTSVRPVKTTIQWRDVQNNSIQEWKA